MTRYGFIVGTLSLLAAVGCGDKGVPVDTSQVKAPTGVQMLEDAASTGQPVGSGGQEIQNEINRIKEKDPAKAARLQKQFDKLITLQNPAQVKAAAKAMLGDMK